LRKNRDFCQEVIANGLQLLDGIMGFGL